MIGVTGGVFESDLAGILRILLTAWLPAFLVSVEGDDLAHRTAGVRPVDDRIDRQDIETAMRDLVESMTDEDLTVLVCKTQGLGEWVIPGMLGA